MRGPDPFPLVGIFPERRKEGDHQCVASARITPAVSAPVVNAVLLRISVRLGFPRRLSAGNAPCVDIPSVHAVLVLE